MNKKKKFSIFSFLIFVLTTIFVFSLSKTFAETPEVSVSGKFVDTIQNVKVSNNEGGVLDWDLQQWATFRINADYDLSGKNVKAGDSTVVTVPDALMITKKMSRYWQKEGKKLYLCKLNNIKNVKSIL